MIRGKFGKVDFSPWKSGVLSRISPLYPPTRPTTHLLKSANRPQKTISNRSLRKKTYNKMFFKPKTSCGRHFEISVLKSLLGGVRLQVPKPPIQQVLVTGVEKGHHPKSPQNPFLVSQMTPPDSMNNIRSIALMTLLVTRWSIFSDFTWGFTVSAFWAVKFWSWRLAEPTSRPGF